ncbi:MAG: YraN family protein [Cytophagaceae bacterium]|jgi:putative endonuclease|nr:YraN family protein [Cytophagaceae bacterium]
MAEHNELGKLGEQIASDYLTVKGFRIIARNWRFKHKEVDIIAYDDGYLVVVEVKTRSSAEWEHPRESITSSKIRFLVQATEQFVQQNRIDNEVRFDVVAVTLKCSNEWDIEHIEHAFTAQA